MVTAHRRETICSILAIVAMMALALRLFGRQMGIRLPSHALLMTASVCFVLVALVVGASATRYGRGMLTALAFCFLGDLVGPWHFFAGLWMFFGGHIALIVSFLLRGVVARRCLATLGLLIVTGGLLLAWLYPHVPASGRVPVLLYMTIITAMATVAGGSRDGGARRIILMAVALFYVSDIFVARWRFVAREPFNAFICYPLYYAACLLFAWSTQADREG